MSKRKQGRVVQSPATDRARLAKAMREGRYQSALDYAKQIYHTETSAENRQTLVTCYLNRAAQLREQGSLRDAATVLNTGVGFVSNDPVHVVRFAEELARCGEIGRALQLIEWLPEPRAANRVLAFAADASLQRGAAGHDLLPDSMRQDFDRIRKAFQHLTANEDAALKDAIQGIGLTSPFREWKLLLRGLLAYYERDDERAIDNWSRLDPARLPARLAAPFRLQCDRTFAAAQSPSIQLTLRRQLDRLTRDTTLIWLRGLQRASHETNGDFDAGFRELKTFLPMLKAQRPDVVERLARCLYWDIIESGLPEDLDRYEKLFGRPPGDPRFNRVHAMGLERSGQFGPANDQWREFEKVVAESKRLTELEQLRARSMIWLRMGRNAERQENQIGLTQRLSTPFGRRRQPTPKPNPCGESCFRRAVELAPDWLDPHLALTDRLKQSPQGKGFAAAAHDLLSRFPEHVPTLEALANVYQEDRDLNRAADMLQRALQLNLLNRDLRIRLASIRRQIGMTHASLGEFDPGRAAFQAAIDLLPDEPHGIVEASWAGLEFKAGNAERAEELLRQAANEPQDRLLLDGWMYGQAIALDLPKAIKARFEIPFRKLLDAPHPTVEEAFAMVKVFWLWHQQQFTYRGSKSHLKKALALADQTKVLKYPEALIEPLGQYLLDLKAHALLRRLVSTWVRQFPESPWPAYFELESYLTQDDELWQLWRLKPMLHAIRQKAEKLRPCPAREKLLLTLDRREQQFKVLNPLSAMFDQFGDGFGAIDDDAFDELEDSVP